MFILGKSDFEQQITIGRERPVGFADQNFELVSDSAQIGHFRQYLIAIVDRSALDVFLMLLGTVYSRLQSFGSFVGFG